MELYNKLRVYSCIANLEKYIEGEGDFYARAEIALAHLALHYEWKHRDNAKLIKINNKFINKLRFSFSESKREDAKILMKSNEELKQKNKALENKLAVLLDYATEYNMLCLACAPELYEKWSQRFIGERFDETHADFRVATETLFMWFEKECSKEIDEQKAEMGKKQNSGNNCLGNAEQTRRQNNIAILDKILGE